MPLHLIHPKATASAERDRVATFLEAIIAVGAAQENAEADDLSVAAEHLALEALVAAEERLVGLTTDPQFVTFMGCILNSLTDIAEGRP